MAKVTDPDTLVRDTDVSFNTSTKRITVTSGTNINSKDGVTLKCIYSFCKEEWKNDATLIPYAFPWTPITDEQFELVNGWDFTNDSSRYLIRDGGWSVVDPTTSNPNAQWAGIISLGTLETNDQPYFQQSTNAPVNFQTTGVINQPVQIFKDVDADGVQEGGDFDYRTSLKIFGREYQQIYGSSSLSDIGVTTMSYQAYRFPMTTSTDLNISTADGTVGSSSPYSEILIRYFGSAFSKDVDLVGTARNFGIVIDVGTHSGVDGSMTASGATLTTSEGGVDLGTKNISSVDTTLDKLTSTAHGYSNGNRIRMTSTGTLPGGLVVDTTYFVVGAAANDFQLAATLGGAAIDLTSIGTGTIDAHRSNYHGGTLTVHEGTNKANYTIGTVISATAVPITTTFAATESNSSFTLQRPSTYVVSATKKQIYEKVQYLLRQSSDIDSSSGAAVTGQTASELLEFVGSTLKAGTKTPTNGEGGGSGVLIIGFDSNDTNDLSFVDNAATTRTYPFVSAGTIAFNANLQNDTSAKYWMFFTYTEQFTNTGFSTTGTAGSVATLNSATTSLVAELALNDYIKLSGFATAGNNGIWKCTGAPAGTGPWTVEITKQDSLAPANETAGPSVSLDKKPVGSPDALLVDNNAGTDITGTISGAASVNFDFDYDNNVQGGRTAATNAAVTIRSIGLNTAQFVETTATVTRATGLSFSLVSPLERNYANAA